MASLVFDIETSAQSHENLDEAQLESLIRPAEQLPEGKERESKREAIERMFNLWPFTAQCVCICMINADSGRGQVLYISDDYEAGAGGPVEFVRKWHLATQGTTSLWGF